MIENKPGGNNIDRVRAQCRTGWLHDPARQSGERDNATLYKNLPFNFVRDIVPVAGLVRAPNVMEVTAASGQTVAEFIAYCKRTRARSTWHRQEVERRCTCRVNSLSMTGCEMVHVPSRSGPGADRPDRGQVHVLFDNLPCRPGIRGHSRARRHPAQREPSLPELPTVAETVPGYEATAWFSIGMPKGTPRDVIEKSQCRSEPGAAIKDA